MAALVFTILMSTPLIVGGIIGLFCKNSDRTFKSKVPCKECKHMVIDYDRRCCSLERDRYEGTPLSVHKVNGSFKCWLNSRNKEEN